MVINLEKFRAMAIAIPIFLLYLSHAIKFTLNLENDTLRELMTLGVISLNLLFFFFAYPLNREKLILKFIMAYLMPVLLVSTSYLIYGDKIVLTKDLFWTFFVSIPLILLLSETKNFSLLRDKLRTVSKIILISSIVPFYIAVSRDNAYDMVLSYHLVIPILFLLADILEREKIFFNSFLVSLGLLIIMSFGSRGPFLVIGVFILFCVLFNNAMGTISRMLLLMLLSFLLVLTMTFFNQVLLWLVEIFSQFNIDSRFLKTFLFLGVGSSDFLTGRGEIYEESVFLIKNNPFFGVGFLMDRFYLNGSYPHNVFLEIFLHFGIPIGTFLLVIFLLISFRVLLSKGNQNYKLVYLIFLSYALGHLMVSGSYFTSFALAGCIGVLLSRPKKLSASRPT